MNRDSKRSFKRPRYSSAYVPLFRFSLGSFVLMVWGQDGTYGLLLALYESIPARKILKVRETYVRMTLDTLARRISGCFGAVSTDEAEALVFELVCPNPGPSEGLR